MRCENDACGYTAIAYNSCRNQHCPKCQGAAAREWMAARVRIPVMSAGDSD
jgi:transposase-like zinc-binding protein